MTFRVDLDTNTIQNSVLRTWIESYLSTRIAYDELVTLIGDTAITNSVLSILLRATLSDGYVPFARP